MARRVSSPEFVGRGPELGALLGALERAAERSFVTVFLDGESGVGKTRLLEEFARAADARDARVLAGDCIALAEGELPYAPIRSALRELARSLDPETLGEMLGSAGPELGRLVPELVGGTPSAADATNSDPLAQSQLFELLLGVLGRLADTAPLVLAVEDIHWADRSTLNFLAFLIGAARHERLMLVCTYRTDAIHRTHPLRAFLADQARPRSVEHVHLDPFTRAELDAQLRGILGSVPESALVNRLHARSEGNAFFVEELLAASAQGSDLPTNLRDALMVRIEVLPDSAQQVLRLAAAHGRLVPHRLLAAVCELPEHELHETLREALARHVLVQRDRETYAFRHALIHETLAADLLPGEETQLHLALAQALERDPTLVSRDGRAAAELYRHWLGASRFEQALGAAVQAGREAEEIYAFAEASTHFQAALELWEGIADAQERAGMDAAALFARAAEGAHKAGDADAIRLIRSAIAKTDASTDPCRAAVLHERLGRYLFSFIGDMEAAESEYRTAVGLLPPDEPRRELALALAALAQVLMLRGRTSESLERCEQAIQVARQAGSNAEEADALNTLGVNLSSIGDRATGIPHLQVALRMSEEAGNIDGIERAYVNLSEMLDEDGRIEEAAELALEGAARAGALGNRVWRILLEGEAATRFISLGRLDEADRLTEAALDAPASIGALIQCGARAQIAVQRGLADEAQQLIHATEEVMPHVPGSTWPEPLASTRAEFQLLRGDPDEARRLGEQALAMAADGEYVVFTARLHAVTARAGAALAERARAAGDEAAASEAATRAHALVDRIDRLLAPEKWRGPPPPETVAFREVCAAEARRAAGIATASDWAAVLEHWGALGMPLEQAYARLRETERHVLDGDRERAPETLAAGLGITRDCGATWLHEQLVALARRARLPVPDDESTDGPTAADPVTALGLTEREVAVLELVARGLTNREIGERLFMAEKTASVHVSRILAKFDVSSRVEAATAAQRLGIVP